jgi:TRAP-type C4-dicarboxylate transport system permease small subunit
MIRKIFNGLITGSGVLSGIFILIAAFLVAFEVVMRYIVNPPTTWSFNITQFFIIYAAYLGAAYTLKENHHVRVEFFVDWLSQYRFPSTLLRFLCDLVLLAFWGFATWSTYKAAYFSYLISEVTQSFIRFPLALPLAAIVLGGFLLCLQVLADVVAVLRPQEGGEK